MKRNFKLMKLEPNAPIIPSSRGEFHFFMTSRYQRFTDGTGISAGSSTPTTANGSNISVVANGLFPFPMSMHSIQVGVVAPTTTISAGHAGRAFKCGLLWTIVTSFVYSNQYPLFLFQQCLPSRFTSNKSPTLFQEGLVVVQWWNSRWNKSTPISVVKGEEAKRKKPREMKAKVKAVVVKTSAGPQSGYSFIEFEMFAELLGQSPSDELYADYRGFQRWCEENNYAMTAANYNIWVSLGRPSPRYWTQSVLILTLIFNIKSSDITKVLI